MKLKRNGVVLEIAGKAVFNCGAIELYGRPLLFPRVPRDGYRSRIDGRSFENYVSDIRLALENIDGTFSLTTKPLITPAEPYEELGCEDARATWLGGECFITYTACSADLKHPGSVCPRIGLASTKDFFHVQKHGLIGPDINDKDAVLFPEYVNGKIALLHRVEPSIQIAWFDSAEALKDNKPSRTNWGAYLVAMRSYVVMSPKFWWEELKIGAGAPPILTDKGWLLIYHGVDKNFVYRAGAALLDKDNPQKVIARSPYPILEPRARYEKEGDVPRVVFPEGASVGNDGILSVYYGAADSVCALATCKLNELLDFLMKFA